MYQGVLYSLVFLFVFFLSLMMGFSSASLLATSFFFTVTVGVMSCYFFVSSLAAYMLYMVYIGGILVLFIYVIIVSSNSNFISDSVSSIIMLGSVFATYLSFLISALKIGSLKGLGLSQYEPFLDFKIIIFLALFLLFVFFFCLFNYSLSGTRFKFKCLMK